MSHVRPRWQSALGLLIILAVVLGCSLPSRLLEEVPQVLSTEESPAGEETQEASTEPAPSETAAPEPLVVTHQGGIFNVYSLNGSMVETRPADGLDYARPNTAQVVGESIYYLDSGGSGMGGVVRRVTSAGVEALDFTAGEEMATITFAVSDDESRIAWTNSTYEAAGVVSQLWIANIDGTDAQLVVESDPSDSIEEYFALETVRWADGDLIYAWQVTGIGGYILFFGWSSLYRYSLADGASTALVPAGGETTGPCWYTLSPDAAYAVGGCGADGMLERELGTGTDTVFPVLPDQGQEGGAGYSPSGERLAYAIARGNYEDEAGQVLVRLSRGDDPTAIATQVPGYFERILWADEERMVVGYLENEGGSVDLLNVDGTRTPIGEGRLIGLMQPAPTAAIAPGLADQVNRRELEIVRLTSNGDYAGPGIDVVVHNPGPDDVTTMIPCGFIFEPDDPSDQRLMVVQPVSAVVPAGGEVTLTVYVVCIDADRDMPDVDGTYTLGPMQGGDLLTLAQCACGEDLAASSDLFAGMKVMVAGWVISSGQTIAEMWAEDEESDMEGAFTEGMAVPGAEDFEEASYGWLDRCGIPRP